MVKISNTSIKINLIKKSNPVFSEYLLPFGIGLIFFLLIVGRNILDPRHVEWLLDNIDPATSYLGWKYFRYTPLIQFPLGANPNYGIDLSSSIVYAGIPLPALIFKYFRELLPDEFQYHGLWILCCFIGQAIFSYKLIGYFTNETILKAIACCFFSLAPAFLWRLHGHYDLLGQWVLLAGFCLYFSSRFLPRRWVALLSVTALIHAYLLAMIIGIWAADLWQRGWRRELQITQLSLCFFTGGIVTVFVMWLAGYFTVGGGVVGEGFGFYRMNLLSLIDSGAMWSKILRDQPQGQGDYEGFNYLGLGILILSLIAGYEVLRKPNIWLDYPRFVPLLSLSLVLIMFALSNRVAFGNFELLVYPVPKFFDSLAYTFRGSGRMFWPVYYLIYLAVFYLVFSRLERRVAITVCTILLVVQLIDSSAALSHFRNKFSNPPKWSSPLRSPLWSEIGRRYKRIIYVLPRNAPDTFLPWVHFAAENHMAINFGYFARVNPMKLGEARKQVATSIIDNRLDPDALYVFEDQALWMLAVNQAAASDMVGMLDGFRILAPGLRECGTCDPKAMTDVRSEGKQNYLPGERISFAQGRTGSKYAVLGWSSPEPWGTWSDGDAAWLILKLAGEPKHDLILKLEGHAFVTEKHPRQEIDLKVNGYRVGTLRYDFPAHTETRTIDIPKALIKDRLVRFEFEFKHPKSPYELGLSPDSRRLGLGLVSLQLDEIRDRDSSSF